MENDHFLEVRNASKKYNGHHILQDFSFSIKKSKIIAILGPSGCGKTTLLNIISGVIEPDEGDIILNGNSIINSTHHCSYMFQEDRLLPWRTAKENVLLPIEIGEENKKKQNKKALDLLEIFGLKRFLSSYPNQLSGGMRRRVAFARTLVIERPIYLFDEPFSGLDYLLRLKLEENLFSFLASHNKTALLVTHDIESAIAVADDIVVLSRNPAKIIKIFKSGISRYSGSPVKARVEMKFSDLFLQILSFYKEKEYDHK